jgi:hypothetical protein
MFRVCCSILRVFAGPYRVDNTYKTPKLNKYLPKETT